MDKLRGRKGQDLENIYGVESEVKLPDLSAFDVQEDLTKYKEYQIRPDLENKFQTGFAKEVISDVLFSLLKGKKYSENEAQELTTNVADTIRQRLAQSGKIHQRYKLLVEVILGEQRGAGVKVGARCLWDPECDSYVSDHFVGDSIFCVASVFALLFY